jgi:hypothetical protein
MLACRDDTQRAQSLITDRECAIELPLGMPTQAWAWHPAPGDASAVRVRERDRIAHH